MLDNLFIPARAKYEVRRYILQRNLHHLRYQITHTRLTHVRDDTAVVPLRRRHPRALRGRHLDRQMNRLMHDCVMQ